jgi:hypothetical protein
MKRKFFLIPIGLFAILVFGSFQNPSKDNSRVTFSVKIYSRFIGDISIHTTLKNNTSDTIEYYLESCNPQNCYHLTDRDRTFFCSCTRVCEFNMPVLHKIAPNAIIDDDPFCTIDSPWKLHRKFRVGFNFVPVDMVKDARSDPFRVRNILWSETLEIK